MSNQLRVGYAVEQYEELQPAKLILLKVPDRSLTRIVNEISRADLRFPELSFVLCESWLPLHCMEQLSKLGSSIATLFRIPVNQRSWFALDGDSRAVRRSKRLLSSSDAKAFELVPGSKPFFFAAEHMAIHYPVRYFLGARKALRLSGISGSSLDTVITSFADEMMKTVAGALRGEQHKPEDCSPELTRAYLRELSERHPSFRELLCEQDGDHFDNRESSSVTTPEHDATLEISAWTGTPTLPHSL